MMTTFLHQKRLLIVCATVVLAACSAGPQITRTHNVAASAGAPFQKILVIYLSSSFDSRRYLEKEIVQQLSDLGTQAVASTSMMNSLTPVTRETFVAMVDEIDADAVLITQLINLTSSASVRAMSPEATYIFRPTYYYNVWSVELAEYVEPEALEYVHDLLLAAQLLSVQTEDVAWAIESQTNIKQDFDKLMDYSIYVTQAAAIATSMAEDRLLAR